MTLPAIKPRRLKEGDTIGVPAPASHLDSDDRIRRAIEIVASLGFKIKEGQHLHARYGYFAGTDQERAADLNALFADAQVDGIICLTGGWGASRLLPYLDFGLIQKNPKVLMGFSDITALLNAIFALTGLVTFHGLVADKVFSPYSLTEFKKVVLEAQKDVLLGSPPPFRPAEGQVERINRVIHIRPGKARGRLVGGNLSLISHLIGTPYLPDLHDKILFLEDVHEEVYRIDRMLTQLKLSGWLAGVAGIVFGKFTDCSLSMSARQFTLEEVLASFCQEVGVPAVSGLMIGHVDDQTTLPVGCLAELDAQIGSLRLLEAAVE